MRVKFSPVALLLLVSCGGGGGDTKSPTAPVTPITPTTPTTPQPGPPAVIVVQAGDAQLSEPGRSVAIRPSVVVKDAAGLAVPNASVTFAVDSGGGSVSGAIVTTGSDGGATLTDWTLGKEPGRNVLRVTAGPAPAAKISATTSWTGVTASIGNVGATGGTITLARPGSLIDGLTLVVPANALSSSTSFSAVVASSVAVAGIRSTSSTIAVAHLSVPLSLPASMIAVTPVITIVSDGVPIAAQDVLIKLPIPRGTSSNIVVVVVDASAVPIGFLPLVGMDSGSVTVTTRGLDASVYRRENPADVAGSRKLSLVVFAGGEALTIRQLYPTAITTAFNPARDSWGAYDYPTTFFNKNAAGFILSEWAAFGRYPNGIVGIGTTAGAIDLSRNGVYMMTSTMAKYFDQYFFNGASAGVWAKYRTDYSATWDRWFVNSVMSYLRYGNSVPVILSNGRDSRMVLVCAWDPATESFSILDHSAPGLLQPLSFVNGKMIPFSDPWDQSIQYTFALSAAQSASAMSGVLSDALLRISQQADPYPGWKNVSLYSWGDQFVFGANRYVPDTLFMVDDTTRVWATVQGASAPINTSLPLPAGYSLQKAVQYASSGSSWPQTPIDNNGSSIFVDARSPANPNKWFAKSYGFAINSPAIGSSAFTWAGWRQVDVVKYALKVNGNGAPQLSTPVTYSVLSDGGPTIPATALYEWNYNDGTALTKAAGATTSTHTFTTGGTKTIDLRVYHPRTQQLIAQIRVTVEASGGFAAWKITNIGVQSVATGPTPFARNGSFTYSGLSDSWDFYNKMYNDIKSGLTEGGFIYLPRDTTFAGLSADRAFHEHGLYEVDGPQFNAALLNTNLELPSTGFKINSRPGYVRGSQLAFAKPLFRAAVDPSLSESYVETGSITSGTISGTSWEWYTLANKPGGGFIYFPWFARSANVTFLGTTLTGTLTYVVRNYGSETALDEASRYTLTITFSAIRIQ
ncbi:MAG: Ig-like domain-containing protein [Gemmatimonadaceae bacterium]